MGLAGRFMRAITAFHDAWFNADPQRAQLGLADFDAWSQWEARKLRYALFWGLYENNAFRESAWTWAADLKRAFETYRHIRGVFNPVHRLGEFWSGHLMGGAVDAAAGDGTDVESSLPIEADNAAIRPALARLWKDTNITVLKDVLTLFGPVLGDVGLEVVDDPVREQVTLHVRHPGHLKWVERDDAGRIKSYIIEEYRYDPRPVPIKDFNPILDPRTLRYPVRYNEEAFLDGGRVVYRSFLNGAPHDWRGVSGDGEELPPEWRAPYGFVPLVVIHHRPVNLSWGLAEPHALVSKVLEIDNVASNTGDYIQKALNAPWLYIGVRKPDKRGPFSARGSTPAEDGPADDPNALRTRRDVVQSLYAQAGADAKPLVYPLQIEAVNAHRAALVEEIERDYPELQMDIWAQSDTSGRALREARRRVTNKVQQRRAAYDAGLVQAQKFALAIGSLRGYPGYQGLPTDPDDPGLEHRIGKRPVFAPDPFDDLEEGTAFWQLVKAATDAGCPLEVILEREGWSAAEVAKIAKFREAEEQKAAERLARLADQPPAGGVTQ
jgi:hypothetical protein